MSATLVGWNGSSKQKVAILSDLSCTASGEFGTEFIPALNSYEIREEVTYEPTPNHILQLKTMAECQNHVSIGMSVVPGLKHVFQLYKATRHLSYPTWS
jgi:hypothetical protein